MIRPAPAPVAALAFALAAAGCVSLDPIPQHQCGNHVVEDSEDCDSADPACSSTCTWNCSAPPEPTACAEGWVYQPGGSCCPEGYVCGGDDLCHAPSGYFRTSVTNVVFPVDHLTLAQLDSTAGREIVGLSDSAIDVARVDASGELASVEDVPVSATGNWSTGPLEGSGDGTAELVGTSEVGVIAFRAPNGPVETMPFTTFVIPDPELDTDEPSRVTLVTAPYPEPFILAARHDPGCATGDVCAMLVTDTPSVQPAVFPCGQSGFMPVNAVGDRLGNYPLSQTEGLVAIGMLGMGAGSACVYHLDEDLASPGHELTIGTETDLILPEGYALSPRGAMVFARVTGQPCPSLLVPTDGGVGVGGDEIGVALGGGSPCTIDPNVMVMPETFGAAPLYAGQIDGVGGDEVVTTDGIAALVAGPPGTPPALITTWPSPRVWHSVAVGDLNRDGLVDVVGSAETTDAQDGDDIDVLRQRPAADGGGFSPSKVFTADVIRQVRIADVDGDFYDDIVFVEVGANDEEQVEVAFGAPSGGAPEVVHVASFAPIAGHLAIDDVLESPTGFIGAPDAAGLIVATLTGGTALYGSFTRHLTAPLVFQDPSDVVRTIAGTTVVDLDGQFGADVIALSQVEGPEVHTQLLVAFAGQEPGLYGEITPIEVPDLALIASGDGAFTSVMIQGVPILLGITDGMENEPPRLTAVLLGGTVPPAGPPVYTPMVVGDASFGGDKPATAPWGLEEIHVTDIDLDGDPDLLVDFGQSGAMGPRQTWQVELHMDDANHVSGTPTEVLAIDQSCSTSAAIDVDSHSPGREVVAACSGQVLPIASPFPLDTGELEEVDQMVGGDVTGDGVDDLVLLRELGAQHSELSVMVQCTTRDPEPCLEQPGTGIKP